MQVLRSDPTKIFAPNDSSKLVEQLDKLSTLVHINKLIVFLSQSCSTLFLGTFLSSLFFYITKHRDLI
jgi:hypothetical protein